MPSSSLSNTLPATAVFDDFGHWPQRKASIDVPHAMASIITRPNDSGQSTGNNRNCFGAPYQLVVFRYFRILLQTVLAATGRRYGWHLVDIIHTPDVA
jgi:hypothetical protein